MVCDRCGDEIDCNSAWGNCPVCGDNLCAKCAGTWDENGDCERCQAHGQNNMQKTNPTIVASFEETVQTGEYDWKDVLLTKVCDENTTIGELVEWAGRNLDRDYFEMKLTRGDR